MCVCGGPQYKIRFSLAVTVEGLENIAGEGDANITRRRDCRAQKVRFCVFSGYEVLRAFLLCCSLSRPLHKAGPEVRLAWAEG